jgi:hypothetical protein
MAFYADRIPLLDRAAIRERVIDHFSASRMTDRYLELYADMIGRPSVEGGNATAANERVGAGA